MGKGGMLTVHTGLHMLLFKKQPHAFGSAEVHMVFLHCEQWKAMISKDLSAEPGR